MLDPPSATPWFGPVRDCLVMAHSTAELVVREGYGPGAAVGAFDVGLVRWGAGERGGAAAGRAPA
ncbi:hypothetical protein [Streptomyces sp. SP18CS02]|uniref:hypothetical protein n=1 Tax=Streptomyces sp. SP18CS02 TaxID=3002531 RepID=UPI002E7A1133|nr:hypothetical protein [Streptomyces sp. SP18CS02]MEE1753048.1 hypothetical protein [Streptomyces sp. SP18CS02]